MQAISITLVSYTNCVVHPTEVVKPLYLRTILFKFLNDFRDLDPNNALKAQTTPKVPI